MLPTALLLAAALALPLPAFSQQAPTSGDGQLAETRAALAKDKRGYVASVLSLTEAESKRFWPIYDNYQRQLDTTLRRRALVVESVVAKDRAMTDAHAKQLASELLAIDDEEAKDRRRMQNQLMRAIPPSKALVYLQIENKARALRAYDIATAMPLVK